MTVPLHARAILRAIKCTGEFMRRHEGIVRNYVQACKLKTRLERPLSLLGPLYPLQALTTASVNNISPTHLNTRTVMSMR
jgi:hypothetical protein